MEEMMMSKNANGKMTALILLFCTLLLLFPGCNRKKNQPGNPNGTVQEPSPGEAEYQFPEMDLTGKTYRILNCTKDMWGMVAYITADEVNDDEINNEAYRRTVWLESKLGCSIEEVNVSIYELKDTLDKALINDPNTYAAAYQRADDMLTGIVEGTYTVLDNVLNLHLDEDYWSQDILRYTSLSNKHYFAASDLQLMSFDGAWCIYFNAPMLRDHGIKAPYQLVKDQKWTLEELHSICAQVCNLNGDETYDWNVNGQSVYGYTTFRDGIAKLLYGIECFELHGRGFYHESLL